MVILLPVYCQDSDGARHSFNGVRGEIGGK